MCGFNLHFGLEQSESELQNIVKVVHMEELSKRRDSHFKKKREDVTSQHTSKILVKIQQSSFIFRNKDQVVRTV